MEERVRELEERLATMERRLGWWRGGGLAVLALAVAVGAWSCGQVRRPDIIRAKSFELLDERGDIRGRWVWTAETGASFALYSATEPAIMMHSKTSESGAFISISHPNGDDAVWLGSLSQGNASFSLSNSATNIGLRVDNTSIAEFAIP